MHVTSLDEAKEFLYGHPANTFVGERDALVKETRSDGRRDLANEIKSLRKPSAIAAEVNQIVRSDPDGISLILQAAGLLRDAQAGALDGTAVDASALQRQYRAAIQGLARSATTKHAEVRAALEAATIDQASNEALRSGCLVAVPTPISVFGAGAVTPASAAAEGTETSAVDELAERRARKATKTNHTQDTDQVAATKDDSAARLVQLEAEQLAAQEKATQAKAAAAKKAEEKAAEDRARREREQKRAARLASLKKAHREAVREHLGALDNEQAASTSLAQAQLTLTEIDDERVALEQALVAVQKQREQAAVAHTTAKAAATQASEKAVGAEAAAEVLATALDDFVADDA